MNEIIETKQKLDVITIIFTQFLCDVLELVSCENINIVSVGNSISAGWTAIDNNVQPLVEKLHEFMDLKCQRAGINLNLVSFALAGNNSNKNIYEFLIKNPTLGDVKKHFIGIFDEWKSLYNKTPFENYVDKDVALSYYSDSSQRLLDFFNPNTLTIASFNGCTGKFLENPNKYLMDALRGNMSFLIAELNYLDEILRMLSQLSPNSYITVGNFPNIARWWIPFHRIIARINNSIRATATSHNKVLFYDGINIDLVNIFNGKIKIDNHPTILQQYKSLCDYLLFLMENLPEKIKLPESIIKKYKQHVLKLKKP